jgi:chemotaxis protein MotB
MRRQYVGRTDAMVRSAEGEQGFWPSYADMMSAVALILFFLMLLSYISNMITGNNLKNTESQLEETRIQLAAREQELSDLEQALIVTMKQVDDAKADLQQLTVNLDEVKLTLAAKEEDLAAQDKLLQDQKALLSEQEQQLSSQKQQLSSQQEQLSSQQQRITEQEEYLAAATDELLEMRGQMQTIAVLRLSILEQIRDSVVAVMGDASKVRIGENGNIVLSEGVFFDVGSAAVKTAAVPTLNQLIEVFSQFLADPENVRYVDSIVISGHTDSTGSDDTNRTLSTQRANAVLGYLLENGGGKLQQYASYFCAAGYGETRPVATNDTEEGRAQNRRIEISIILKDDSIMDIVDTYLNIDLPTEAENRMAEAGA